MESHSPLYLFPLPRKTEERPIGGQHSLGFYLHGIEGPLEDDVDGASIINEDPGDFPPETCPDDLQISYHDCRFIERLTISEINTHTILSLTTGENSPENLEIFQKLRDRRRRERLLEANDTETNWCDATSPNPSGRVRHRSRKQTVNLHEVWNWRELGHGLKSPGLGRRGSSCRRRGRQLEPRRVRRDIVGRKWREVRELLQKNRPREEMSLDRFLFTNLADRDDDIAKVEKELSAEEVFARKKIKLAEVGMSLLEDPESNIKCLKELLHICNEKDHNIAKLGLMSLVAVFKDIIPGYRIRLPTEKELEMKVSKEIRQTRFYESTLLSSYKAYLLKLIALEEDPSFHCVAVRCMCILLDAVPHFNFRENLVAVVVRNLNSSDDVVRKLCCETLRSLFTNEGKHEGQVTLEAVLLISELVKAHDCHLHPDILEVFLSLKFDEDLGKARPKENAKVSKKKKRKKYLEQSNQLPSTDGKRRKHELMTKTREELNADMKSVSFTPDNDERRAAQSEILSAIFGTYFRIIRHCMDSSLSRPMLNDISSIRLGQHPLLGPCLTGLGKFSHLIDLDFMGALMGSLKKLAGHSGSHCGSTSNSLTVSEKLQCCIVAFRVMRNNLDALNVDLQEFYVQLYNLLLEYRPFRDRGDVLAEALKTMLWEGKQHDMHRAAAFVKRLATFSLSFGSPEALAALVTIKHLLLRNSKCRGLLENDPGGGSLSGLVVKYRPDASDPHLSGALASVLWELSLLSKHYNPSVSSAASSMLSTEGMNPSQTQAFLSTVSPTKAFEDLTTEQELFKAANKKFSPSRKIKSGNEFVLMNAEDVRKIESVVDEDVVEGKFEEHFKLLKDFDENERLRLELDRTSAAIRLYGEYRQQKKLKRKAKEDKKRKCL
ncbi:hypothetical protein KSP39_PZI019540 [Platanthera zijinensis]|uniref:Nucleolar complex protein 3 homolog n=1 Tax=Platanthera zijinensis TaxID=2320716 RepID=A0AAP0FXZ9_9ASPA